MLKLRDGRELEVAETVAEVMGAKAAEQATVADAITKLPAAETVPTGAATNSKTVKSANLVTLHEIRRTVKRKCPTPVDTKAEFRYQVIEHVVNLEHVIDMQPTVDEIELLPVHDRVQAKMPAVSGPFKHDFDQHAFKFGTSTLEEGRPVDAPAALVHEDGSSAGQQDDDCNTVTTEGYPKH